MIPGAFDYHRPGSLPDVHALLAEHGDAARVLAGGHSLIPVMKMRLTDLTHLIDLQDVADLKGIEAGGNTVTIGAMVTQHEVIASEALAQAVPLIREAAEQIADPQVRYVGTVGGNVANGDPANDMPGLMQCLDARFELSGPEGTREVAARKFYLGAYETARRDDLQTPVLLEATGSHTFDVPGKGPFELRARVDRIDLTAAATYAVYDYKGASGPTNRQVQTGWAQQLPLQGAMVAEGAFDVAPRPVSGLHYIQLKGGREAGREVVVEEPEPLVANALDRLRTLLTAYAREEQGYVSQALPETVIWEGDYDHLARVREWSVAQSGDSQ